jgi:hypothetical protein
VDWKGSEMKFSGQIWYNICIATDLKGCCHDPMWGDVWVLTDVKECCHEIISSNFGLEIMWQDIFAANLK